jgi:hypothetical protein
MLEVRSDVEDAARREDGLDLCGEVDSLRALIDGMRRCVGDHDDRVWADRVDHSVALAHRVFERFLFVLPLPTWLRQCVRDQVGRFPEGAQRSCDEWFTGTVVAVQDGVELGEAPPRVLCGDC